MPSIDITILNGLPVTIDFDVEPAEPDVGYMSPYIPNWTISHVNGRKQLALYWLLKRIDANEEERILNLCYDAIS